MWIKIPFNNIQFLRCKLDCSGNVSVRSEYFMSGVFRGKDAYLSQDSGSHLYDSLRAVRTKPKPGVGQSLYVSKSSKMPRALLRGSDYKIVLDKDKADCIIVPFPDNIVSRTYRMVGVSGDNLYIIKVVKDKYSPKLDSTIANNVKNAVIKYLDDNYGMTFYFDEIEFDKQTIFFVRKCDEYGEMLREDAQNRYCFDTETPFVPTTEINPENLEFLVRCRDRNVFERMVFGSEWQKYPLTICALLCLNNTYYSGGALKLVEEAIDYDDYRAGGYYESNREVTPDDWNMLQKWMLYRNGIDEEKGGYMSVDKYENLDYTCTGVLNKRVAIKPIYITEPVSSRSLHEMLK